jgi:hypothetical protein
MNVLFDAILFTFVHMKKVSRSKIKVSLGGQRKSLVRTKTSTDIEGFIYMYMYILYIYNLAHVYTIVRWSATHKITLSKGHTSDNSTKNVYKELLIIL